MIIGIDASRANVAERTGTENYAWEVIGRLLTLLGPQRIRLYVREPLRSDWPALPSYVEVRILHWPPGLLWSHVRLSWEMLWRKPDVLFVPADTVPLVHPEQTITTIHDIGFERFPEVYRGRSVQRQMSWLKPLVHLLVRIVTFGRYSASERDYHRWSVRQAIRASTQLLTVSEFTKREIVDVLKVPADRLHVIPLGVHQPEYFSALTTSHRDQVLHEVQVSAGFMLFVGRLESKKNIAAIIQAYDQYRQLAAQPLDLVLVGNPGYGWEEPRRFLETQSYRSAVHVLGWQPDSAVDVLHVCARTLICISKYEGFGIPAVESLSAGVPVVASRHGSLPDMLGPAAIYVSDDQTDDIVTGMIAATTDDHRRRQCIQVGLQRVRQFTWETTAKKTAEILLQADLRG